MVTAVGLIIFILFLLLILKTVRDKKAGLKSFSMPENTTKLLMDHVAFYTALDPFEQKNFEARIEGFLKGVKITGVDTIVEDIDRILIASGAIIPIFAFPDWQYNNISEILLYQDSFNKQYKTHGSDRNILGMVGDGALNRQMLLSKSSVRESFLFSEDGHNTVIHEFAHLIDKTDGAADGIPEALLSRPYIIPWIERMHETMEEMTKSDKSDINYYGLTNDAEFFAVVSEYFFERPDSLKAHHPELFSLLDQMFHPAKP